MKTNRKLYLLTALALMLGASLWLTGCESDSVAPHDQLPALNSEDVAYQAAAVGAAASRVLPQIVDFTRSDKTEYTYTFPPDGSDVIGSVYFDFRNGGPEGASADYDVATWCRMNTATDAPLVFVVGAGGTVELDFNIFADIVQATHTATLLTGSVGTFTGGDYVATFAFDGVVVTAGENYPSGGTMTFVSGGHVLVVTFDGDNTATISLDGEDTWIVNLEDGTVTEVS